MTELNELLDMRAHNNGGESVEAQRQAPRQVPAPPLKEACQGTRRSEVVVVSLQKAMEGLVKAQDHLNSAADQAKDDIAKPISGFIQKLREFQREISNIIHIASCGK